MSSGSGGSKKNRNYINRNTLEVEKQYSASPSRASTTRRKSFGESVQDVMYGAARAAGDAMTGAATGVINEISGYNQDTYDYGDGYENASQAQSLDRGGVRIPTYAEFQKEQEQKNMQFFMEQQRAAEAEARKRLDEDRKKIQEIHDMLRKEIEKYEKAQTTMNENLEKIKKILLLEEQQAKTGIYHITHAEVLVMMFRSFVANVSESNTWLEAMISRKKKRGSLFAVQSKSKGTQYSMSQELAIARSSG